MQDWKFFRLSELISVKHGFAFAGEHFREKKSGDILLTPGNVAIGGGFQGKKLKYYIGPVPHDYVLAPGDVFVTMTDLSKTGDTLGFPAKVPNDGERYLHNQRLGKLLLKPDSPVRLDFVYWILRTEGYRNEILATCTGSTVKHTSPSRILAYGFYLPTKAEQARIAELLDTIDAKIALNRQMNETLEATARAIFKDWFVDFGPVRAKAEGRHPPGLASDIAALFPATLEDTGTPLGWRRQVLGNIAQNVKRSCQPDEIEPGTPYIALENMPRRSIALNEWSTADNVVSNKLRLRQGEFLFGKLRPYFHRVGVAPVDGVCTTDVVVVSAKDPAWSTVVLFTLFSDEFVAFTDQASTGTKMPRTSWQDMARYPIVCPSEPDLPRALNELVSPMLTRIATNITEVRTLSALRDLLLPKLMSGEIRIRDAERLIEKAA